MVNRLGKILASTARPMDVQVAQPGAPGDLRMGDLRTGDLRAGDLRTSSSLDYYAPTPERSSRFEDEQHAQKRSGALDGLASIEHAWASAQRIGQASPGGYPAPSPPLQQFAPPSPLQQFSSPLQQFAPPLPVPREAHFDRLAPPLEPYRESAMSFNRESVMSYASSIGWQSSCASFASEACGEPSSQVVVGRRAAPHVVSMSVVSNCPRREEDGALLSLGSRLHDAGDCIPCKFFRSNRGCRDGALCKLCHHPHAELSRSATRRAIRRKGLERRAFFDSNNTTMERLQAQTGMTIKTQNTFLHFQDEGVPTLKDWAAPQRVSANF